MEATQTLHVRIPKRLLGRIDDIARQTFQSRRAVITAAIMAYQPDKRPTCPLHPENVRILEEVLGGRVRPGLLGESTTLTWEALDKLMTASREDGRE